MATTLQSSELLIDVIRAFAVHAPAARMLGGTFAKDGLKYNKTYTPHVATLPTAYDVTTTYAITGSNARDLLIDAPIKINKRQGVRLKWENVKAIEDDKWAYNQVISSAGAQLARAFMTDLAYEFRRSRFSKQTVETAAADVDVDTLDAVTESMNAVGAGINGRVLVLNSASASSLGADPRVSSRDYAGRQQGGSALRSWREMHGFELVQEWPSLPSNTLPALTSVASADAGDLFTKTSHGLQTGDKVDVNMNTGIADGEYYVIKASDNTFQVASSYANALAGTPVAITVNGDGAGTVTLIEGLLGFASDGTAVQFLAGPEDHSEQMAMMSSMGIPNVIDFDSLTDPDTGISMSLVKQQDANTGDFWWMPVLIWGKRAGMVHNDTTHGRTVGDLTDYGGHRITTES